MKNYYLLLFSFLCFSYSGAQTVSIPDINFKNILTSTNCTDTDGDGILDGDVDFNNDGEIQVTEAESITWLRLASTAFAFDFNLEGIQSFVNLTRLNINSISFEGIDLSGNLQLQELKLENCLGLSTLDVSLNTSLTKLSCSGTNLISLDLSANTSLVEVDLEANIGLGNLNVSGLLNLERLNSISNIAIATLDLSDNTALTYLNCDSNGLRDLDLTTNTNLVYLNCRRNQIESLDLSLNTKIDSLNCQTNFLNELNIKNNSDLTGFSITGNESSLKFVCVDEFEQTFIQNVLDETDFNTVVNSYCSFAPGGKSYSISGQNTYDISNDGCTGTEFITFPNLKFNITSQNGTGVFSSNSSGTYAIPFEAGAHTIEPFLENPDYFEVSPSVVTVDYPSETSPFIQNFCIKPVGVINDLDIILLPLEDARPGFDTAFKLVYKNKGNTVLSGSVELEYLESQSLTYISSIPEIDNQINNILSWDYTDLLPFESREIDVVLNLNPPTDPNFPLNGGDILTYRARIFPFENDQTEIDNEFCLRQEVVNSFDPNDKRCLEGETITDTMVGEFVHYMIRFENTGSASAINVVIKDNIDNSKFDISTLRALDASHDYIIRKGNSNDVEFIFENINLPFDDANNDGYVVFKIKTLNALTLGDTFSNSAEIYFDFNFPIITNDYITTVDNNLSVNEIDKTFVSKLYPNPVRDKLQITSNVKLDEALIYDINGRLLKHIVFIGNEIEKTIDFEGLQNGIYFTKLVSADMESTYKIIKN